MNTEDNPQKVDECIVNVMRKHRPRPCLLDTGEESRAWIHCFPSYITPLTPHGGQSGRRPAAHPTDLDKKMMEKEDLVFRLNQDYTISFESL